MSKAIVLLSGGLDSATTLAIAENQGYELYALSVRYGQRHSVELVRARQLAKAMGVVEHRILDIDLRQFGGSALTDDIPVPKSEKAEDIGTDIPVTYVPARNTVLLSYALAWAEILGCLNIFIGVNALDYSGYPDCRTEFIKVFENMANLATKMTTESPTKLRIHAPLIMLTKAEIIREGTRLGVPYDLTSSCYDPQSDGTPCGSCDSCLLRAKGFAEAGRRDPLL